MPRSLLLTLAILAGCGPVRVTVGLVDAERAVREARDAGAAEHAPYPLTLAEELLAKAIEEKGYAEWEQSFLFAGEAVERAHEATALCKQVTGAPLWPAVNAAPAEAAPAGEPATEEPAAADPEPAPADDPAPAEPAAAEPDGDDSAPTDPAPAEPGTDAP
jgi:hypothetical protein